MLAINQNNKIVIYSLGKTGTTSLINSLSHDWYSTGEISADFMSELYPNNFTGYVDQYKALQFLHDKEYAISIIIRDPWKRYVSGIKEILQDNLNVIFNDPINEIYSNLSDEQLIKFIDKIFYLSEFKRENGFDFDVDFPYPSDFAIHHNYHIRNWLYTVKDFDATFINSNNLNNYISDLGLTPTERTNVSNPEFIKRLETCIKKTNIYFYIERYLHSEIETYQKLI